MKTKSDSYAAGAHRCVNKNGCTASIQATGEDICVTVQGCGACDQEAKYGVGACTDPSDVAASNNTPSLRGDQQKKLDAFMTLMEIRASGGDECTKKDGCDSYDYCEESDCGPCVDNHCTNPSSDDDDDDDDDDGDGDERTASDGEDKDDGEDDDDYCEDKDGCSGYDFCEESGCGACVNDHCTNPDASVNVE